MGKARAAPKAPRARSFRLRRKVQLQSRAPSDRLGPMGTAASRSVGLGAVRIGLAAVALSVLAACTTSSGASPSSTYTYSPPVVINEPNSQHGPYVAVAVDNHFHDIHPTDPPTIAANRP